MIFRYQLDSQGRQPVRLPNITQILTVLMTVYFEKRFSKLLKINWLQREIGGRRLHHHHFPPLPTPCAKPFIFKHLGLFIVP